MEGFGSYFVPASAKPGEANKMRSRKRIAQTAQVLECRAEIERMLKNSQTKVIMPALALGVLRQYSANRQRTFSDGQIRNATNQL
jgi:hypothetical protein